MTCSPFRKFSYEHPQRQRKDHQCVIKKIRQVFPNPAVICLNITSKRRCIKLDFMDRRRNSALYFKVTICARSRSIFHQPVCNCSIFTSVFLPHEELSALTILTGGLALKGEDLRFLKNPIYDYCSVFNCLIQNMRIKTSPDLIF